MYSAASPKQFENVRVSDRQSGRGQFSLDFKKKHTHLTWKMCSEYNCAQVFLKVITQIVFIVMMRFYATTRRQFCTPFWIFPQICLFISHAIYFLLTLLIDVKLEEALYFEVYVRDCFNWPLNSLIWFSKCTFICCKKWRKFQLVRIFFYKNIKEIGIGRVLGLILHLDPQNWGLQATKKNDILLSKIAEFANKYFRL